MQTSKHQFEETTFPKPTYCDYCNKLLWGLVKQGVSCKVCGYISHSKCQAFASENCGSKKNYNYPDSFAASRSIKGFNETGNNYINYNSNSNNNNDSSGGNSGIHYNNNNSNSTKSNTQIINSTTNPIKIPKSTTPTESSPATICHSLPLPNQISSLSTTTDPESPANYIVNPKKSATSFKTPRRSSSSDSLARIITSPPSSLNNNNNNNGIKLTSKLQKNQSLPNIQTSVNSPNIITKNDYSSITPRAAKPLSPTTMTSNNTTFSTKVIHDLLVSSALNVENASKSTHDSSLSSSSSSTSNPPPLNLQTTTVNFRKFVQKCGFIFDIQDSVENLITWKNPANTLLAMVIYINVCFYPQLLIILPLIGLLITSIYFYQKKFPQGPPPLQNKSIKSKKTKTKKFKKLKYSNLISPAAENSVDYLKNMQNIQNLMGMISDGYDSVLPLIKYIDWSDEALTLRITSVVIIGLMVLSLVAWIIPWSYVFMIGGVSVFIVNTQFVKALTKESTPFILQKNKLLLMKITDYFEKLINNNDGDDDDDDDEIDGIDNSEDDEIGNQVELEYDHFDDNVGGSSNNKKDDSKLKQKNSSYDNNKFILEKN